MQRGDTGGSWWKSLVEPRPYAFALLILAGLVLELVVHYQFQIAVVYTHFYYLIIVVAGLWYGRKALWIALFFGGLHITVSYIILGIVTPDALIRALMFVIVAFVVGIIVEQMNYYRDQLVEQNRELKQMNEKVTAVNSELNEVNARLVESREAFETANKKLNLLSTITRHDIKNQLLGLLGFLELSKEKISDPEILSFIVREETAAQNIQRQIEFTKNYEDIGVRAPQWQNIGMRLYALVSSMSLGKTDVSASLDQLEIFADPLLEKVFENLIDNSLRHGDRVNHMSFSCIPHGERGIAIVYEDDGIGVHETEKERIFEKGFGKNTGLGLFLSREILSITGLNMRETGVYGKGARFEIVVPQGKYRFLTEKETS